MNGVQVNNIEPGALAARCHDVVEAGGRMQMAYAREQADAGLEVNYLVDPCDGNGLSLWRVTGVGQTLPSLARISPLLGWYEREISDLFGLAFDDHPEPEPLVLHEGVDTAVAPMLSAYPRGRALDFERRPWRTPAFEGNGLQRLPFGPVRADVMESAQFVFFYLGENILHYLPRLFFKHRGMEKRFEGVPLMLGSVLAERVSGVGSVAHALAYAQAVEAACDCQPPPRAAALRSLLAELERLYNHLHYQGHLAATTTLKVGGAEGKLLEERVKQMLCRLTGSRFGRGLIVPGGLRRDLDDPHWLVGALNDIRAELDRYLKYLAITASHRDRLIGTGVLPRRIAFDQGATGPVERASGLDRDMRRDHAYAGYHDKPPEIPYRIDGDVMARFEVRSDEIHASLAVIFRLLRSLPGGAIHAECEPIIDAQGLGWAESPRGTLYYAVHLDGTGRLGRVKIKSPSFSNWRAFVFTVYDSDMMDYAINEASFGLTVAGCDR